MEMKLLNWTIGKNKEDQILAWGNVINHPCIPEGRYVHTSGITNARTVEKEACVCIETRSGHLYKLEWNEINTHNMVTTWDDMWDAFQRMGISGNILFTCMERKEVFEENLKNKIVESELYIEVAGGHVLKAYDRNSKGIRKLQIRKSLGMFSDSVYITDGEHRETRAGMICETSVCRQYYFWPEGIETIKIRNAGSLACVFWGREGSHTVYPHQMKTLSLNEFGG